MSRLRMYYRWQSASVPEAGREGEAYLLAATQQLLHEADGALLLRRQVDLGYRVSERELGRAALAS
jgi:hypothetical protein